MTARQMHYDSHSRPLVGALAERASWGARVTAYNAALAWRAGLSTAIARGSVPVYGGTSSGYAPDWKHEQNSTHDYAAPPTRHCSNQLEDVFRLGGLLFPFHLIDASINFAASKSRTCRAAASRCASDRSSSESRTVTSISISSPHSLRSSYNAYPSHSTAMTSAVIASHCARSVIGGAP